MKLALLFRKSSAFNSSGATVIVHLSSTIHCLYAYCIMCIHWRYSSLCFRIIMCCDRDAVTLQAVGGIGTVAYLSFPAWDYNKVSR